MNSAIQKAWSTALERFFCPDTDLFYEFVYDDTSKAWNELPTLENIADAYPNPCGWGTGMEDSVMNTSTALDTLVCAERLGKGSDVKGLADRFFDGLMRCTASEKNKGFVARSVSPIDGKSHYIESSRDQYTHLVYSFLNFYFSPLSSLNQQDSIRSVLSAVAEKCIREVIPENEYNMLREDGTIGKVNKMWGDIGAHEWMRLPMFYLAAYAVTEDRKYKELYDKYRDKALENSLSHDPEKSRCYCSLQMQLSLRAVYDYDTDNAFRSELLNLMKYLAQYGENKSIQNSKEFSVPERGDEVNCRFVPWNKRHLIYCDVFGGYKYYSSGQTESPLNTAFYPVREVGEGAILAAICPERSISHELSDAVLNMAQAIDLKKHSSVYAPLYLPCAYALCTENRMKYGKNP